MFVFCFFMSIFLVCLPLVVLFAHTNLVQLVLDCLCNHRVTIRYDVDVEGSLRDRHVD